jgi:hypothetical protein
VSRVQFSIIIPLEFHRRQSMRCIEAWARAQSYPRERYQLLVAAPHDFLTADLELARTLLAPQDRIERFSANHDMSLVAAAAETATGDVLLFTEAHAIPEPDTLERVDHALRQHPEWSGFSFRSVPITHNLLSEIEAQMYGSDIERNMADHPWLKVLDQCLVVTRDAYRGAGGIEPEFGHFAEWLFAARLHRAGKTIGYHAGPAIHHYYVGDLRELETFTLDFAGGEIRFAASRDRDPCGALFPQVPELADPRQWTRRYAWTMARLRWRALRASLAGSGTRQLRAMAVDLAYWFWRAAGGTEGAAACARARAVARKGALRWHLLTTDRARSHTAFVAWIQSLVLLGRMRFLRRECAGEAANWAEATVPRDFGSWDAGSESALDCLGFYDLERHCGRFFRWSADCAAIFLPPGKGEQRVAIEWANARPLAVPERESIAFCANGRRLPSSSIEVQAYRAIVRLAPDANGERALSWTVDPFHAPGDARLLGLPVTRVAWETIA